MNKLFAGALMSAGLLGGASLALAQPATPGDTPQARPGAHAESMHRHHARHHGGERAARAKAAERVEARLAYIHAALKITDAQQPQWEAFANVLRKQARQMDEFREKRRADAGKAREQRRATAAAAADQPAQARQPTAIDRLERRQKMMTFASRRLDEVIAAAKPLYASLSPEQQQAADELIARQGRGRMGHHRMHHGA